MPEEYDSAKRTTFSQFLTSSVVMASMHDALDRLGVPSDGMVLEPGCGIARFMTNGHRYIGVEQDSLSGRIARALHPNADIRIEDFQRTKLPPLDAVIGNVPFANVKLDQNGQRFSLHDFFIAKGVDALKLGGILAVVTSHFTLDKQNGAAREYMASKADFLGAIRLPSNAFKAEGTDVVTDIVFLRKREPGQVPKPCPSAPAVPFLFELLESPAAKDKVRFIRLLVNLAIGYLEWHIPLSFDPATRFTEVENLGGPEEIKRIRTAEPEEDEDDEPERHALWQRDAFEAVHERVGTFQALTRDADAEVRTAAVKALAWFPGATSSSIPFVREAVVHESEPNARANAILSLGILGRYLSDQSDVPTLLARLSPGETPSVRLAAAISLAVILGNSAPPDCLSVLLDQVQSPDTPDLVGWHWLEPIAHASQAITATKPEPTEAILAAMCRAAELVSNPWGGAEVINTSPNWRK